jgi:protein-disulfide isomerase
VNEVREYVRAFPRDVRLVWKDAPKNSLFHDSLLPHKALRCAANQDKFWPYLDKIFGTSDAYDQKFLEETARATGLNMPAWTTCLTLKETVQAINDNAALSEALDIGTLPAVFINNKQIRLLKGIDLIQILKQINVKQ